MATIENSVIGHEIYWHEIFNSVEGGSQGAVTLVLMYHTLGEDYAYHMAGQFDKGLKVKNLWKDNQIRAFKLKILKNKTGPLSTLLNRMEKDRLLISREELIGKQRRKYFSINPDILLRPGTSKYYFGIFDYEVGEFLQEPGKKK
jgi:hypothetical protein